MHRQTERKIAKSDSYEQEDWPKKECFHQFLPVLETADIKKSVTTFRRRHGPLRPNTAYKRKKSSGLFAPKTSLSNNTSLCCKVFLTFMNSLRQSKGYKTIKNR